MKFLRWLEIAGVGVLFFVVFCSMMARRAPIARVEETEEEVLPRLSIELNGVTLSDITSGSKQTKYLGNTATFVVDGNDFRFENVEIKGRGNSTWRQEKKPFQIKLGSKENLFGLKKAKKWVLLANQLDDSHLRNDVGLFVASLIDEEYVTSGEFLELAVDGEEQGLYYLTHKVEISNGSVNLKDPYGVLFELDNAHSDVECFYTGRDNCLILKDAVLEDDAEIRDVAVARFLENFNLFETATQNRDWEAINNIINIESFAEYYLISEFSVNPDAYFTSNFLYKNGDEDKIHAGPAWDFDFAFGNYRWGFMSPESTMARAPEAMGEAECVIHISPMMFEMMTIPEFQGEVKDIFQKKLSGKKDLVLERIDVKSAQIRDAAIKNNALWERDDFDEAVSILRDWVGRRFDYFEQNYGAGSAEVTW